MEIPPDAVRRTTNGRGTDYAFLTGRKYSSLALGFDMLGRREMMVVIGIASGNLEAFRAGELYQTGQLKVGRPVTRIWRLAS
jgi:hypothetical protein